MIVMFQSYFHKIGQSILRIKSSSGEEFELNNYSSKEANKKKFFNEKEIFESDTLFFLEHGNTLENIIIKPDVHD